jgi:hypothetical protein
MDKNLSYKQCQALGLAEAALIDRANMFLREGSTNQAAYYSRAADIVRELRKEDEDAEEEREEKHTT